MESIARISSAASASGIRSGVAVRRDRAGSRPDGPRPGDARRGRHGPASVGRSDALGGEPGPAQRRPAGQPDGRRGRRRQDAAADGRRHPRERSADAPGGRRQRPWRRAVGACWWPAGPATGVPGWAEQTADITADDLAFWGADADAGSVSTGPSARPTARPHGTAAGQAERPSSTATRSSAARRARRPPLRRDPLTHLLFEPVDGSAARAASADARPAGPTSRRARRCRRTASWPRASAGLLRSGSSWRRSGRGQARRWRGRRWHPPTSAAC